MEIPFCTEIRTLGGVNLPRSVICFDVRMPDDARWFKAPWGETLWASERAAYKMGLKVSWSGNDTCPLSCQAYEDFRSCNDARLAKVALDWRKAIRDAWRDYRYGQQHPAKPGDGGSCYYKPVGIALANYGWSLICDRTQGVVAAFGRWG